MNNKSKSLTYSPGIFDPYKREDNLNEWENFPEIMWGLGYEMDCCNSFEEYVVNSSIELKPATTEREQKRNKLYLLEHAERQIVGNYLFSEWRRLTHWEDSYDQYDVDYLRRIITILESKEAEKEKTTKRKD